jgi:hypothetical protein
LNNWFVPAEFRLFCGTENSRNSIPNHSAEEKKKLGFPYRGTKIKAKILGIPFQTIPLKAFNSEFRSVEQKEANSRNSFPKYVSGKNMLSILFAGAGFFVKPILFMSFRSVPSFGITLP